MGRPRTSNQHLPKGITIITGSYWYKPPGDAKRVRVCKVGEESTLYRYVADKMEPTGDLIYMREIFDRYEKEELPKLAPKTQVDYRRIIYKLREVFGDMKPDDVEPRHVGALLHSTEHKVAANRLVSVLSAVFSKARGRWYVCKNNPCTNVERNETSPRDRYISDEEYKAVYELASPRLQIAMDLAYLTGQRQGDLLALKWEHVHTIGVPRDEWGVFFQQGKTGKRLMVNISPELEEVLKRARMLIPQVPRTYVIRNEEGLRYTQDGFRSCWQKLMNYAMKGRVAYWTSRNGKPVMVDEVKPVLKERFTFHDLRAKHISDSQSLAEASATAGHATMAMTRRVYDRGIRRVSALNKQQRGVVCSIQDAKKKA